MERLQRVSDLDGALMAPRRRANSETVSMLSEPIEHDKSVQSVEANARSDGAEHFEALGKLNAVCELTREEKLICAHRAGLNYLRDTG
jgi:hypothetical protein